MFVLNRKCCSAACMVLVLMGFILFSSCTSDSQKPVPTDQLVVYCPPEMNRKMDYAKTIFEKDFPQVQLTYRSFGDYQNQASISEYNEILTAELNAGRGPDLICFCWDTFPDLYKVLDAGVFYNLDAFLLGDEDFDPSDYLKPVLDGGLYKEQRLFIPLTYYPAYVMAWGPTLKASGIALPKQPNYAEWTETIIRFYETHSPAENRKILDPLYPRFDFFLIYSGLQIVNYEAKELCIDQPEFKQFMEIFRSLYPYSCTTLEGKHPWRAGSTEENLYAMQQEGSMLFDITTNDEFVYEGLIGNRGWQLDTFFSFPRINGEKTIGMGRNFVAINNASSNKVNAYAFMKILLSAPVQDDRYSFQPIYKAALADLTSTSYLQDIEAEEPRAEGVAQGVEYYRNYSGQVMDLTYQTMLPFFERKSSYDECLQELRNKLTLYLYE